MSRTCVTSAINVLLTPTGRTAAHIPHRVHCPAGLAGAARRARLPARRADLPAIDPEYLAEAIVTEIDRPVDYRPVETDGAARTAALLAELL
jgi:hypothetical protein